MKLSILIYTHQSRIWASLFSDQVPFELHPPQQPLLLVEDECGPEDVAKAIIRLRRAAIQYAAEEGYFNVINLTHGRSAALA
ncbi:MAG: hypothetical protein PHW53_02940 [Patescibacteria group bacterium]|nr:hypothetical protein [Patescibacteria group bacterium]